MIEGVEEVQRNLADLSKKYGKAVTKVMTKGGTAVRADAIKSIQQVTAGNTVLRYTAQGNPYSHIAAGAGEAPNTDTGTLVKSIQIEIKPDAVYVVAGAEYASSLEFGNSTMQARPFLIPALENNRRAIEQAFARTLGAVK